MQVPISGKQVRYLLPWILSFVALGIVGLGAIVFTVNRSRGPSYDLEALTVPVETSALTVRVTASGTVEPIQTVNLSPKASGILEKLYVEQGDRVIQGHLIAQMENRDLAAQLRQREATVAEAAAQLADIENGADPEEIAQAEAVLQSAAAQVRDAKAQVRDAAARLELAKTDMRRNQQLEAQGAIAANEMDGLSQVMRSAQAMLESSQAALESAEFREQESLQRLEDLLSEPRPEQVDQAAARLAQAQAQLESMQVQMADTRIQAPFDGTITQKFATEGAFVTPTTSASDASSATSTAIVALASDLEVLAEVPETDIAQIYSGQAVEIVADAFPDETFQGQVRLIAPEAIERQNVTLFQIRIDLLEGQSTLLSNMNVTVAFIGEQLVDALVVPTMAVVTQEGQSGVLVPGDRDHIRFKPVALGSQVGNQIQITEGLSAGERVFVDLPRGKTLENLDFGPDAGRESE